MSSQVLPVPYQHSYTAFGVVEKLWTSTTEAIIRLVGSAELLAPLLKLAELCVVRVLQNVHSGSLRLETSARTYLFPMDSRYAAEERVTIRVLKPAFWIRIALTSDLGFAEAYMFGEIECDDLASAFSFFLSNKNAFASMPTLISSLFVGASNALLQSRFLNTLGNARGNISAHYDISNDMFKSFLSKDMTYSCAIFNDPDAELRPDYTAQSGGPFCRCSSLDFSKPSLEDEDAASTGSTPTLSDKDELYEAQLRKLQYVISKCDIRPGHRVLEIGSGWGSMALQIITDIPDTTVDTLTLSIEQKELAERRIIEALGAEGAKRIRVHLMDYRKMPSAWKGGFDRFVSVEMMEAVGKEYLETYWRKVSWALKPNTGVGVVQCITLPEARYSDYIRNGDFIQKWVLFPGCHIPTFTALVSSLTTGSQGTLVVDSVRNIGPHYSRTLREWRKRFEAAFDDTIVPALKKQYPAEMGGTENNDGIAVFRRKWVYYFTYCEFGFSTRLLGDHIITFTREGNYLYM